MHRWNRIFQHEDADEKIDDIETNLAKNKIIKWLLSQNMYKLKKDQM